MIFLILISIFNFSFAQTQRTADNCTQVLNSQPVYGISHDDLVEIVQLMPEKLARLNLFRDFSRAILDRTNQELFILIAHLNNNLLTAADFEKILVEFPSIVSMSETQKLALCKRYYRLARLVALYAKDPQGHFVRALRDDLRNENKSTKAKLNRLPPIDLTQFFLEDHAAAIKGKIIDAVQKQIDLPAVETAIDYWMKKIEKEILQMDLVGLCSHEIAKLSLIATRDLKNPPRSLVSISKSILNRMRFEIESLKKQAVLIRKAQSSQDTVIQKPEPTRNPSQLPPFIFQPIETHQQKNERYLKLKAEEKIQAEKAEKIRRNSLKQEPNYSFFWGPRPTKRTQK